MSSLSQEDQNIQHSPLPWSEKYRATNRSELVGYQSVCSLIQHYFIIEAVKILNMMLLPFYNMQQFKQLLKWLKNWYEQFLDIGTKQKRKKQNDSGARKALLLSGPPGRGKTTSAKLVSQMLGFQAIEVQTIMRAFESLIQNELISFRLMLVIAVERLISRSLKAFVGEKQILLRNLSATSP